MNTLFSPGQLAFTRGALELAEHGVNLLAYLRRHLHGDWGELDEEDKKENNFSVVNGYRILSSYTTPHGKLWIISEANREVTTLLLPDEY